MLAGLGAALTRLRVAFDVLPLAGELTGVGRFCAGLAAALIGLEDLAVLGYAVARRARTDTAGPAGALGLDVRAWSVPTRVANAVWERAELPPIEWLVGQVDVVHGTNYVVPPARHAARVVSVHDLTALRYPEMCVPASLAYPRLVRRAARHGAYVHVPSGFVRDEVVEQLGVDVERVRVVPYGVDGPGQIASVRPPTSPPSIHSLERGRRSAPYVLALGAVEPRKNLPTLVRAFAELAPTHEDLELVVAGPGGWGETAFQAAVAACGVAGRVVRLGYLQEEDRLALLSGAVALAYPSLYEGFGFPPLEAMAAGVPVVASSAGSLPEVLGDAAELVAAGDDMALADALARVIDDAGLRSRLIEAGRVRAASFTWASAAASIVELYRVAAHEKQARSC